MYPKSKIGDSDDLVSITLFDYLMQGIRAAKRDEEIILPSDGRITYEYRARQAGYFLAKNGKDDIMTNEVWDNACKLLWQDHNFRSIIRELQPFLKG